jgi:hypothetical protein
MRIFLASVLAVAIIAGGAYAVLKSVQQSTADVYTTGSSRLDWQERSNLYGREVELPSLVAE